MRVIASDGRPTSVERLNSANMLAARTSDAGNPISAPYRITSAIVAAVAARRGRNAPSSAETAIASTETCMPEMQIRCVMPASRNASVSESSRPLRSPSTNARTSSALFGNSASIRSEMRLRSSEIARPRLDFAGETTVSSSFAAAMPVMPAAFSQSRWLN